MGLPPAACCSISNCRWKTGSRKQCSDPFSLCCVSADREARLASGGENGNFDNWRGIVGAFRTSSAPAELRPGLWDWAVQSEWNGSSLTGGVRWRRCSQWLWAPSSRNSKQGPFRQIARPDTVSFVREPTRAPPCGLPLRLYSIQLRPGLGRIIQTRRPVPPGS